MGREFAMLPSKVENIDRKIGMRNMSVHNVQGFQFWMQRLKAFTDMRIYNMYYSMATFSMLPKRNPNTFEIYFENWNEHAHEYITGYDMLIDIDAGSHKEHDMDYAHNSSVQVSKFLNSLNTPYHLRFSGRGFHFVIPYRFFPNTYSLNPNHDGNLYQLMMKIAEYLFNYVSEQIDKDIYDVRRVAKIPMSLSIYDGNVYVCKPIKDIDNFQIETYLLQNNNPVIIEADTLHNADGSVHELIIEVLKHGNKK
jgi:hypothetical protein